MVRWMRRGRARVLRRITHRGRKVSDTTHTLVVPVRIPQIWALGVASWVDHEGRRELKASLAGIVCAVGVRVDGGLFVLDHLIWAGADAAHGAVFALDGFAERLCTAPTEEEESAEEESADGSDNNADNCTGI